MKKLTCLLLCAVLLSLGACSAEDTGPENPYRAVSYKSEFLEDGVVTGWDLAEYQYDENGYQTESRQYRDGILTLTNIYENDAFGNILKVTSISQDKTAVFDHKLTLDDHGRVLLEESYTGGALCYTLEYAYDKNGNMTREVYTTMEEDIAEVIRDREMAYDRQGRLIRETDYTQDGSYHLYDYEDGKQTKISTYDSGGELLSYREYTYNDKGRLVQESSYTCHRQGDSRTSKLSDCYLYSYDETGCIVTLTNHSTKEKPVRTYSVTTYDEYGNKLLKELYMDGALYWRITLEYERIP